MTRKACWLINKLLYLRPLLPPLREQVLKEIQKYMKTYLKQPQEDEVRLPVAMMTPLYLELIKWDQHKITMPK